MDKSIFFFNDLLKDYKKTDVKLILVTHLLIDRPEFIESLSKIVDLALIIPKPKTINKSVLHKLKEYNFVNVTRNKLNQKGFAINLLKRFVGGSKFIISDIGGYFAGSLQSIKDYFKDQFLGVVEDTENGFRKYAKNKNICCPIYSVAKSPLKLPEDTLIAYSTVYSAERILRDKNEVFGGKKAVVIGFGKIGSCIAKDLSRKQVITNVYDINPTKLVYALSEGFNICNKNNFLKNVDLIFAVTGNKCLNEKDLQKITGKVYVFSITSSDDEFNFDDFSSFNKNIIYDEVILTNKHAEIHLVNKGNAVNFLHGAVVGDFIRLVQGEIIISINELINRKNKNGFLELSEESREFISKIWLKHFS
jgi:adenosylhomocysteinase